MGKKNFCDFEQQLKIMDLVEETSNIQWPDWASVEKHFSKVLEFPVTRSNLQYVVSKAKSRGLQMPNVVNGGVSARGAAAISALKGEVAELVRTVDILTEAINGLKQRVSALEGAKDESFKLVSPISTGGGNGSAGRLPPVPNSGA